MREFLREKSDSLRLGRFAAKPEPNSILDCWTLALFDSRHFRDELYGCNLQSLADGIAQRESDGVIAEVSKREHLNT
jgi:hypothetical protein